jgi:hypothetical protein
MLRTTVNSFDLFDTLLARLCITPTGIAEELERKFNAPGFAAARRNAEHLLAGEGKPFDLHAIYALLVSRGVVPRADADRLLEAEFDAEFDNAIPIIENLRRGAARRPGDFRHVPVRRYAAPPVAACRVAHTGTASRHEPGKARRLGMEGAVRALDHQSPFRDNPHSDVAMPRRHGIDSVHYAGALPTTNELTVSGQGYPVLAQLMRSMRLRNPYERSGQQAALWHLSSQLNIPLLVLGSAMVRQQRESAGLKRILFSARDCYLMSEVFSALFPADPAHYLHVSREVLGSNSPVLRDYLTDAGIAEALVVDLAATGASWHQLSAREQLKVRLFSFVFIDNWVEARVAPQTVTSSPWLDFSWAMKSSGLRAYSAAIEAINSAPHPSCRTIHRAGRFFVPEHHSSNELPDALLQAIIQHQTVLLEQLRKLKGKIAAELAAPVAVPLLATLVESMSQSDLLNSIEKLLRWPPNSGPTTP